MRCPKFFANLILALAVGNGALDLSADQPIFNEMPRWKGGWGVQLVHEYRHRPDWLAGRQVIAPGLDEEMHLMHLEGVYTWDKSIRLTAKIPYVVDAQRELLDGTGALVRQKDSGLGDVTLALPLKRYFNLDGRSGSWTLAPQLRLPTAEDDEYAIFDHQWGTGLSIGYETETYRFIGGASVGIFGLYGDDQPESNASLDLGVNYLFKGMNGHVKWETDLLHEFDGTLSVSAGPSIYLRITDTLHTRVEWKHDFYSRHAGRDHGNDETFKFGIAFVF